MRPNIRDFVRIAEEAFSLADPIYEFGSFQIEGQEAASNLRGLFPGKSYIGCDMRPGRGVDRVEDVERGELPKECAGSVILVDTLEHIKRPEKAIAEIHRILKPGGILLASSVMDFPIHNHPHDYWRFTPEGFKLLLSAFSHVILGAQGDTQMPHTIFGVAFKNPAGRPQSSFDYFLKKAPNEIKTGIFSKPYKRKIVCSLAPFLKRSTRISDALNKYLACDDTHFELVKNSTL